MEKILLSNYYDPAPLNLIRGLVPDGFELVSMSSKDRADLLAKITDADYLIVSGRQKIDAELLENAHRLKMIQRTGVGTEMLDLDAIEAKGIPAYKNKGINAQSVAEYAILLMLASIRRIVNIDSEMKSGKWSKQANGIRTRELHGMTVGLIGLGDIGRRVARMLAGFGVEIKYYDVLRASESTEAELGIDYVELEELLKTSDVISLHCPLTDDTRHMINEETLALMKEDAVLINTARGPLIDQKALYTTLKSGGIKYAAIDVYENEPIAPDSELLSLDNVITTPHIGGITEDSFLGMWRAALTNIAAFQEGRRDDLEEKRII